MYYDLMTRINVQTSEALQSYNYRFVRLTILYKTGVCKIEYWQNENQDPFVTKFVEYPILSLMSRQLARQPKNSETIQPIDGGLVLTYDLIVEPSRAMIDKLKN